MRAPPTRQPTAIPATGPPPKPGLGFGDVWPDAGFVVDAGGALDVEWSEADVDLLEVEIPPTPVKGLDIATDAVLDDWVEVGLAERTIVSVVSLGPLGVGTCSVDVAVVWSRLFA